VGELRLSSTPLAVDSSCLPSKQDDEEPIKNQWFPDNVSCLHGLEYYSQGKYGKSTLGKTKAKGLVPRKKGENSIPEAVICSPILHVSLRIGC